MSPNDIGLQTNVSKMSLFWIALQPILFLQPAPQTSPKAQWNSSDIMEL